MKNTLLSAVLVLMLLAGGAVRAQDDTRLGADQRAALATVNTALTGLRAAGSYTASGTNEQSLFTHMIDSDTTTESRSTLTFETDVQFTPTGELAAAQGQLGIFGSVRFGESGGFYSQAITSFRVIGDQLYQRIALVLPTALLPDSSFLHRWHVLSAADLIAINRYEYGSSVFALQGLIMPVVTPTADTHLQINGALPTLDAALVLDAAILRDDMLDGVPVVVIEVTLDPFPVLIEQAQNQSFAETGYADLLDDAAYQALAEIMRDKFHIQHLYWIGPDDQRLYHAELLTKGEYNTGEMNAAIPLISGFSMQDNMTFVRENQDTFTFSAFGEIASIEAPPGADLFLAWYE